MKKHPGNETISETIELYKNSLISDKSLILNISDDQYRYVTKLVELNNNEIIFEAPIHKLDWVLFSIGDTLEVCFKSKLCIYDSKIRIVNKYRQGNSLLYVATITSPIIKKQQRESFRLDTIFNITYCLIDPNIYNSSSVTLAENLLFTKAVCVNISSGGMCFNSSQKEDSSHIAVLRFNFMDTDFNLYGEILEVGLKNNVGYYQHRIRFIDIDKTTINLLTKSIYKKQQLLLKTSKS